MTSPSRPRSVAVVGAGLAGAATAWPLARRGIDVTLLERTEPANPQGSSHGSARIFRITYPDPFYAALAMESRTDWHDLQEAAGRGLITPADALDFGRLRDVPSLACVLVGLGLDHEVLPPAAAAERWPGIRFDTEVLRHDGGVIDSAATVAASVELARAAGAQVRLNWLLTDLKPTATGYALISAHGERFQADAVVLAPGAWLPTLLELLPDSVRRAMPPLQVYQEQVFHFRYVSPPIGEGVSGWPTFIHKTPQISTYSLPGGRDADFTGQKLAQYRAGKVIASAADADHVVDPENRHRLADYAQQTLPGVHPTPYSEATCLFTMTPTEDFVIHPHDGLTILSACSGHGAKFAPLLGRLAAAAVVGASMPSRFTLPIR